MGRKPSFSIEQDAEIARRYLDDGVSMAAIATQAGKSENAVRNSLLRSGATLRPRRSPQPQSAWTICACGSRAVYASGVCRICYDRTRNADPANRDRKFSWWLMAMYNLPRATYDTMLTAQNGACAVCLGPDPRGHRLAVDHDHVCCPGLKSCGRCVLGLLCVRCNRAKGLLQDSAGNAGRLLAYLSRPAASVSDLG